MMTIPPKIFFLLLVVGYLNLPLSNLVPDDLQPVDHFKAVVVLMLDVPRGAEFSKKISLFRVEHEESHFLCRTFCNKKPR